MHTLALLSLSSQRVNTSKQITVEFAYVNNMAKQVHSVFAQLHSSSTSMFVQTQFHYCSNSRVCDKHSHTTSWQASTAHSPQSLRLDSHKTSSENQNYMFDGEMANSIVHNHIPVSSSHRPTHHPLQAQKSSSTQTVACLQLMHYWSTPPPLPKATMWTYLSLQGVWEAPEQSTYKAYGGLTTANLHSYCSNHKKLNGATQVQRILAGLTTQLM